MKIFNCNCSHTRIKWFFLLIIANKIWDRKIVWSNKWGIYLVCNSTDMVWLDKSHLTEFWFIMKKIGKNQIIQTLSVPEKYLTLQKKNVHLIFDCNFFIRLQFTKKTLFVCLLPHRYFVEDIISQQVADRIVKDTHNNITAAIRQTVKPYIIFKSDTDGSFAAVNGKLPAGSVGYTLSNIILNGFTNLEQKLKKTTAKKATNSVTADLRMSVHNLEGRFDYKIDEAKPVTGKATVTVGRIDVNVSFNMLKPAECKADVSVNLPNVKYATKISADSEKALTNSYVDGVKSHLSAHVCKAIGQMFKPWK